MSAPVTSWGPRGSKNTALVALESLRTGETFVIACSDYVERTRVPNLVRAAARRRGFEVSTRGCQGGFIVERLPPVRI